MHHPAIVPIDAVRNAIYLDVMAQAVVSGYDLRALAKDCEPVFVITEPLDLSIDPHARAFHAILLKTQAPDLERVCVAAIA